MHSNFIRLVFFCGFSFLQVYSMAGSEPTPPPSPPPTVPPISPKPSVPPTPTVPPVSPPPTPTIPPVSPPPVNPPPVLERASPQAARAVIRYGPGNALTLTPRNDWGRFQKVALQPNQVVTVIMSLSLADVGKPADVQILDGGAIAAALPQPPPAQ